MYYIDWPALLSGARRLLPAGTSRAAAQPRAATPARRFPRVSSTVWALGVTSLLTDISSEMVTSILPLYLVLHLGISPLAFGIVDGLHQGAASIVRIVAGFTSDRSGRYKQVAAFGYALSAACRLLLLAAGAVWSTIAGVIVLDRVGKGIRTAPRDALISHRSSPEALATAFGVHRALDAVGAMLGPVIAFAIIAAAPGGYDVLFVASFAIAIVGVAAIVTLVPARSPDEILHAAGAPVSMRTVAALLKEPSYRRIVAAGSLLGLATISDAFVFLMVQQRIGMPATAFPLLYVATSLFTALGAAPCGYLADRVGRTRVLLGGYGVLLVLYALLLVPIDLPSLLLGIAAVGMLGAYYAATDGVLTALTAARLPGSSTGSGLSILATAVNLSRLASSVLFGWMWTMGGAGTATLIFAGLLAAAFAAASYLLPREAHASHV